MPQPISFRWDEEFIAEIDAARGTMKRSPFVRAAVERALETALSGDTQAATPGPPASAGGRSGHSHTEHHASAIGAVPAWGASRPAAPPRAPASRKPVASPGLERFAEAQRRMAKPPKKGK